MMVFRPLEVLFHVQNFTIYPGSLTAWNKVRIIINSLMQYLSLLLLPVSTICRFRYYYYDWYRHEPQYDVHFASFLFRVLHTLWRTVSQIVLWSLTSRFKQYMKISNIVIVELHLLCLVLCRQNIIPAIRCGEISARWNFQIL